MKKNKLILFFCLFFFISSEAQLIDSVYTYIKESGIQHPRIVMKQAVLETGWFKSPYLMKRNNLFGFRYKKAYMKFDTWQKSVDYYKKWQAKYYKDPNEDYFTFLLRIKYAQSPTYIQTLKRIKLP
jgi:flagellum-specific peptidoglycan hydrolase FlgJ